MADTPLTASGSWLYSCNHNGELQGRWKLDAGQMATIRTPLPAHMDRDLLEQDLIDSLLLLKKQNNEPTTKITTKLLCQFLSYQDATVILEQQDWGQGVQLCVVDYELPSNNLMLTVFSVPNGQPMNQQQLTIAVQNFVSSGGSCCGL